MLQDATPDLLNTMAKGTMMEAIGIEFTETGTDYLCASMPVDHRTVQPMGLLHGGASAALAETLGSMGSSLLVDINTHNVSGIEVNANHLRAVREGKVHGKATIIHKGRTQHVWSIEIKDDTGRLVCAARLTVLVIPRGK
jgi:1,4-dihydroxy-2-naphthoyl-CoA hydrolase